MLYTTNCAFPGWIPQNNPDTYQKGSKIILYLFIFLLFHLGNCLLISWIFCVCYYSLDEEIFVSGKHMLKCFEIQYFISEIKYTKHCIWGEKKNTLFCVILVTEVQYYPVVPSCNWNSCIHRHTHTHTLNRSSSQTVLWIHYIEGAPRMLMEYCSFSTNDEDRITNSGMCTANLMSEIKV